MIETASHTNKSPSAGQPLKAARLAQGIKLEEIAKKLRISKRHLIHLEEDQETLICDVYTLGFLKSYAQFLGLDDKDLCQQFKNKAISPPPPDFPFPAPLPGKGMPSFRILALSFCFFVVVTIGWEWYGYDRSPAHRQNDVQAQTMQVASASPKSTSSSIPSPLPEKLPHTFSVARRGEPLEGLVSPAPPSEPFQSVILKVTEESWIEVKDEEGNLILSQLFEPEESYEFKNPQNLILKTGNAKGIQLYSGEKTLTFPSVSGAVKSNISLDPEKWVE